MEINVIMIDDDKRNTDIIKELIDGENIAEHKIIIDTCNDFDDGCNKLKSSDYDILILDIFRGKPSDTDGDRKGEEILDEIKRTSFIPVIFFSASTKSVEDLKSDIIRIVTKTADGNEELKNEISYLIGTGIPFIKKRLSNHIRECMRAYLWEFIQRDWEKLSKEKDQFSIGYLLARRIAKSFSRENVNKLLEDRKACQEKIYPMEFYIYPVDQKDTFETGDIIRKGEDVFIIITPSCDIQQKKTEFIHLASCTPLKKFAEYKKFKSEAESKTTRANLCRIIQSRGRDCHYFLPGTFFIENSVIDFQQIRTIGISELDSFTRVAKLDSPFSQSMLGYFIRYYNRIGTEDLDADYILKDLD